MKKYIALLVFAFISVVSLSQQRYQATVYLKNGNIIPGVIIERFPDESIKLKIDDTHILLIQKDEILKITEVPILEPEPKPKPEPFRLFSQGKFEISGGVGFPDMSNLKIRYGNNMQIGVSCGIFDPNQEIFLLEIYLHYAGKSKIIEQRPWYLLVALGFEPSEYNWENQYGLLWRVGRSINFSKRMGLNLDVGALFPRPYNSQYPWWPSGSISFFIRF
ncbi:MAG: hypothetical protein ABSA76_09880 [Bacteroidales bacterium]